MPLTLVVLTDIIDRTVERAEQDQTGHEYRLILLYIVHKVKDTHTVRVMPMQSKGFMFNQLILKEDVYKM